MPSRESARGLDEGELTFHAFNCSSWGQLWASAERSLTDEYRSEPERLECDVGNFLHYFDYLYYSIVTASTVGFGDFAPPTTTARVVTAIYVICIVAYIPRAIGNAVEQYGHKREFCIGRLPSWWQQYVVLIGPVTPSQLSMFVHEFCALRGTAESTTQFVLLSPLDLTVYRDLVDSSTGRGRRLKRRIFVQRGDVISSFEARLRGQRCVSSGGVDQLPVDVKEVRRWLKGGGGGSRALRRGVTTGCGRGAGAWGQGLQR